MLLDCRMGKGALFARHAHRTLSTVGTLRFAHPTFPHSANTYSMEAGAMFLISGANP
jgi:hypothetical protein